MIPESEYTPTMRELIDVINRGQGEAPYNLSGFQRNGDEYHMVFVKNPKYNGEHDD